MHGIETLKKDLSVICKTSASVDNALEDGKVSLIEGVGIAKNAVGLWGVVKSWKNAADELKDLTADEKKELVAYFESEFDLRNDVAEMVVESALEVLIGMIKTVELSKNLN